MSTIAEGSLVLEKNGGPTMTVKYHRSGNRVFCEWRDGDTVRGATFPISSLRLASASAEKTA